MSNEVGEELGPNPPYGEKGHYRKVTVTLAPELYEKLVRESVRRKIAREPNPLLSALFREAVALYLTCLEAVESSGHLEER